MKVLYVIKKTRRYATSAARASQYCFGNWRHTQGLTPFVRGQSDHQRVERTPAQLTIAVVRHVIG